MGKQDYKLVFQLSYKGLAAKPLVRFAAPNDLHHLTFIHVLYFDAQGYHNWTQQRINPISGGIRFFFRKLSVEHFLQ